MMKRVLLSGMAVVLLALGSGCSDTTDPDPTERWVYYSSDSGVYRHDLVGGKKEHLTFFPVNFFSRVAENGVLIMERRSDSTLFGRCEDGSVIPVPFPVHSDPNFVYARLAPAGYLPWFRPALSFRGHHAAFHVVEKPRVYPSPDTSSRSIIVRFDCAAGTMKLIDITRCTGRADEYARGQGAILMKEDGSTIWFTVHVERLETDGRLNPIRQELVQWDGSGFTRLDTALFGMPAYLNGFDPVSGTFVVLTKDPAFLGRWVRAHALSLHSRGRTAFAGDPAQNGWCFGVEDIHLALRGSEFAYPGAEGIELRRVADGTVRQFVSTYLALLGPATETYLRPDQDMYSHVAISPDGEWIVCTLLLADSWPDPATRVRIVAVKRDGSDIRDITATSQFVPAVVSNALVPR